MAGLMRTLGAPGLDRGRRRIAERGADHRRLGALLVPVGGRPRRRAAAVFQLDQGDELEQLDGSARHWNARADEGGRVRSV